VSCSGSRRSSENRAHTLQGEPAGLAGRLGLGISSPHSNFLDFTMRTKPAYLMKRYGISRSKRIRSGKCVSRRLVCSRKPQADNAASSFVAGIAADLCVVPEAGWDSNPRNGGFDRPVGIALLLIILLYTARLADFGLIWAYCSQGVPQLVPLQLGCEPLRGTFFWTQLPHLETRIERQ